MRFAFITEDNEQYHCAGMKIKSYSVKAHYLDASALVKLVADDADGLPGRDALRAYYYSHADSVYATSYCVAETFSVFKRKQLRGTITGCDYIRCIHEFIRCTVGTNLRIDEMSILSPKMLSEGERLFNQHGIDFIDALQIVTVFTWPVSRPVGRLKDDSNYCG